MAEHATVYRAFRSSRRIFHVHSAQPEETHYPHFLYAPLHFVFVPALAAQKNPTLRVSDNKRFLVYQDGTPFFYLGDTAWELFHRLNREEAERYLKNRASQGFYGHPGGRAGRTERPGRSESLRPDSADR